MLFQIGKVRWTQGVLIHDRIESADLVDAFGRYIRGDWGEVGTEKGLENDMAIAIGGPIEAAYQTELGETVRMRTEDGRTIVSLPEEQDCPLYKTLPNCRASRGTHPFSRG